MIFGNVYLPKGIQAGAVLLAVMAVAIADVLIKKAATGGTLWSALRSPWLLGAVGLYLFQIVVFTITFHAGWKLSIIGILQTALYALIVLSAGVLFFHESLTRSQMIGVLLAIVGVVLMTSN